MACMLLTVVVFLACVVLSACQDDGYNDYIVVLSPPSSPLDVDAMTFLNEHIEQVTQKIPDMLVKRMYKNLANMGYFAYSMSMKEEMLSAFGELKIVQSVEDVLFIGTASNAKGVPNYVPFTPSVVDGDHQLSRDGVCTYTHNSTNNMMDMYQQASSLTSTVCPNTASHYTVLIPSFL
jgi:hypothetical protein